MGGDGAGFEGESLGNLIVADFDGDEAIQAGVFRFVGFADAPGTYRGQNFVGAEACSGG